MLARTYAYLLFPNIAAKMLDISNQKRMVGTIEVGRLDATGALMQEPLLTRPSQRDSSVFVACLEPILLAGRPHSVESPLAAVLSPC